MSERQERKKENAWQECESGATKTQKWHEMNKSVETSANKEKRENHSIEVNVSGASVMGSISEWGGQKKSILSTACLKKKKKMVQG